MNWIKFIDELSLISGTNDKIDYLKKFEKDAIVRSLLLYTYDPTKTYGIKSKTLDYVIGDEYANNGDLEEFFEILEQLSLRDLTGNEARGTICNFVSQFVEADYFLRILDGSLQISMGTTGINKAIPKLIPKFKVMLAKKYKWNEKLPFVHTCVSQKFDGVRCICIKKGRTVKFLSRTGKRYTTLNYIIPEILELPYEDFVLDGEIIRGDGTGKYFQELMKEVRKKDHTMKDFKYMVFDMMMPDQFYGKDKTIWFDRQGFYNFDSSEHIINVNNYMINDYEHLMEFWEEAMNRGWEGLMLRNSDAPYEAKRTGNLLKMKAMQDAEFEVIGYQEGDGRLKNSLGAMGVKVGAKTVWVGSGFSDADRDYIWRTKPIGVMATIQYFEKTDDGSLRFPVFKSFREEEYLIVK